MLAEKGRLAAGLSPRGEIVEPLETTMKMMRDALDGVTYEDIGRAAGITKSAVDSRVRALAVKLQAAVGVVGVDQYHAPPIAFMRAHKDDYLEALSHYHPEALVKDRTFIASERQIDALLLRIGQYSRCALRDQALLLILLATAAMPTEICRLDVSDYLYPDGRVRTESRLRARVAANGVERPLYFLSEKTIGAIDAYLAYRLEEGQGIGSPGKYRGLDPGSRLFLTTKRLPLANPAGGGSYAVDHVYRKIFVHAGQAGVNAKTARRAAIANMHYQGLSQKQIAVLLGVKVQQVRTLLVKPHQSVDTAMKKVI